MGARRGDYVDAVRLHVDARRERDVLDVFDVRWITEVVVPPTATCEYPRREGQFAVFLLQVVQRVVAAVPGVVVQHYQARHFAGGDADVRAGPLPPPAPDLRGIGRGVEAPAWRARMLPRA